MLGIDAGFGAAGIGGAAWIGLTGLGGAAWIGLTGVCLGGAA